MKPQYNPRRHNVRPFDGPKSTSRWFDDRREDRRNSTEPCGFKERD